MEEARKIDWEDKANHLFINKKWAAKKQEQYFNVYQDYLKKTSLDSCIFIASSSTSGKEKVYALKKEAFLCSAQAVCDHSDIKEKSTALCPLPLHHVGGLAIYARAYIKKQKVLLLENWNPKDFYSLAEQSHYISLVPTQVYDIVEAGLRCPPEVEAVFVGGDRLSQELHSKAFDLQWPLHPSYGATEFCSQIATAIKPIEDSPLELLPHMEAKTNSEQELLLKSKSLFHSYWDLKTSKICYPALDDDGFYLSEDRALIKGKTLKILGRGSDYVKVMGEALSLITLEEEIKKEIKKNLCLLALPHERKGHSLHLIIEGQSSLATKNKLKAINESLEAYKRIESYSFIEELPKNELGKIKKNSLLNALNTKEISSVSI